MRIGLDYDGTITEDPATWAKVVQIMRAAGHEVHIVTMRYPSEIEKDADFLAFMQLAKPNDVHGTSRKAKKPFMEAMGVCPHIWIDDNPQAVHMSALEIWGSSSPEGVVVVEDHGSRSMKLTELPAPR